MKRYHNHVLQLFFSLVLSLFLFSLSVLIILNFKPLYYSHIKNTEIQNHYSLTEKEIKENYKHLINYNMAFQEREFKLPHLPYSEEGVIHFQEVRAIFKIIKLIFILTSFLLFLQLWMGRKKQTPFFLLGAGLCNLSILGLLSLFIFMDFSKVFVLFHEIAFQNDLWLFDPKKDPIILYLPESFFLKSALSIAFLVLFLSLFSIILFYYLKKKHAPK